MSERLAQFQPEASEHLQIACRAQHIRRWALDRSDYPEGRTGYKTWRSRQARLHASLTTQTNPVLNLIRFPIKPGKSHITWEKKSEEIR